MLNISNIIFDSFRLFLSILTHVLKIIYLSLACLLLFIILILIQKNYIDNAGVDQKFHEFVIDFIMKNQKFDITNFDCITTSNENTNNFEVHCKIKGSENESKIIE